MLYSKLYFDRQPKIPVPIFLVVLIMMFFVMLRFFSTTPLPSRASKYSLKRHTLTNLSYNKISIFWETESPLMSYVAFGESPSNLDRTVHDVRDVPGEQGSNIFHLVDISELMSGKTYYYVIFLKTSKSVEVVKDGNGAPFMFKTLNEPPTTSTVRPAYGKILLPNGVQAVDALVLLNYPNAYSLSSLTKASGEWLVPLNNVIDKASHKQIVPERSTIINIEILSNEGRTMIRSTVENASPLPQTVVLGKNYDFVNVEEVLSAVHSGNTGSYKFSILSPREGAVIPGNRPLIRGTAYPQSQISIQFGGIKDILRVTTDKNGIWKTTADFNFTAGQHRMEVKTSNKDGKEEILTRMFTIAKSGEQVLGEATAEPTLSSTPTPTPAVQLTATPTPLTAYDPTPTATSSAVPVSGSNVLPYILGAGALIIAGVGVILAF